jgi:hypothetical protein
VTSSRVPPAAGAGILWGLVVVLLLLLLWGLGLTVLLVCCVLLTRDLVNGEARQYGHDLFDHPRLLLLLLLWRLLGL